MYYVHLGLIIAVCAFMYADSRLHFWDKTPYEPKDRVWLGFVSLTAFVSMVIGPSVVHSFLMWVITIVSVAAILCHDYDDEARTWKGTGKLAVCWYMALFSLHSFATN